MYEHPRLFLLTVDSYGDACIRGLPRIILNVPIVYNIILIVREIIVVVREIEYVLIV
jgi:hypothetical protein